MATDENIRYIDVNSGVVKSSHHATFDEAWYLQPSRPPTAQLLYDLGIVNEEDTSNVLCFHTVLGVDSTGGDIDVNPAPCAP